MTDIARLLIAYVATLTTFAAVDVVWLVTVAIGQFQRQLGAILKPEPDLGAAVAFYVIFALGVVFLAVRPALAQRSVGVAAVNGAVLGFTAYATFDLTNLAVIKGWTIGLAALDMAWGTALSAGAAAAGYAAGAWRGPAHGRESR